MLLESLEALQFTLVAEFSQSRGMFTELAHIETLLAETYRDRVQYELLQNSDDAGATRVTVSVVSDGSVNWANNGRPFNASDAEALCRSATSTKTRGQSIGYRGIGFKSLAAVASHIEVKSAGVSFNFDRGESVRLLNGQGHTTQPADIPLIRIPSRISHADATEGAEFLVTPLNSSTRVLGPIDPLALLFLRHVQTLTVTQHAKEDRYTIERHPDRVARLSWNGNVANFATLQADKSWVAIPLDDTALSMTTLRGRLACFLPLDDQLGLPLVVSGDFLTDPSRSHAVVADITTQACLAETARTFASQLSDPRQPWFQRGWDLLTMAEDPRSILASGLNGVDHAFMTPLREYLNGSKLPFAISPIPINEGDLAKIFPTGAPAALYRSENLNTARAFRAAFGLPAMDVAKQVRSAGQGITADTIEVARQHVEALVKALGRPPNEDEKWLIASRSASPAPSIPHRTLAPIAPTHSDGVEFPEVVAKWRTAELAVLNWLNSHGWQLTHVSKQNLGYDLVGLGPDGNRSMIEIKRVARPDARFAMTNNEMGAMQAEAGRYLLGIVIGDGRYTRFMLLDPTDKTVPRERVCRAWEWQFLDWSRHGTYVT
jgi:Domain of unknown function (DUF3883)